MRRPGFVVGVGGGTGSGKSTLVQGLAEAMPPGFVVVLPADAYYRDRRDLNFTARSRINYDHPAALEVDRLVWDLTRLRQGQTIRRPVYDFRTHLRLRRARDLRPAPLIVVEGILILVEDRLRQLIDLKVFVRTPARIRRERRKRRDVAERGRSPESVRIQYRETVQPMHDRFVEPSSRHADLEIPGWGPPETSVRLLTRALRERLPAGSLPPREA